MVRATPTTADERRRELEAEDSRLLAQAVGDHLPFELALRAAELVEQALAIDASWRGCEHPPRHTRPVSYTHLTLPTICSV